MGSINATQGKNVIHTWLSITRFANFIFE